MRTTIVALALVALTTSCAGAEFEAEAGDSTAHASGAVSVDLFRDALAPYGMWVQSADYGAVWVPSPAIVGADFIPYATGGRWEYSTAGWMFASSWDWGWAPFHYGRWYIDPFYGWVWVPDTLWAPAWVDWRFGGGLIGWAPLPPRFHRGPVRDHRARWVFVHDRDFRRDGIGGHLMTPTRRAFDTTAPIRRPVRAGHSYWFAGPDRARVEAATHTRIQTVRVDPPRPGAIRQVQVQGGAARSMPVPMRARRPRTFGRSMFGPVSAPPFHREPTRGRGRRR
jgi:hypothetical protein